MEGEVIPLPFPEEPLAEVIELENYRAGVETINGKRIRLGELSFSSLVILRDQCDERITEARTDRWVCEQYLEQAARKAGLPFDDGPEGAA